MVLVAVDSAFVRGMTASIDAALVAQRLVALEARPAAPPSRWSTEHQHNAALVVETDLTHTPPATFRERQAEDCYLAYLQKLVRSLAPGKVVFRDVLVGPPPPSRHASAGGAAQRIIAENDRKARERKRKDVADKIAQAASLRTLEAKIHFLDEQLLSSNEPESAVPGLVQLVQWSMEAWMAEGKPKGLMEIAVRVFRFAHDVYRRFLLHVEAAQLVVLQEAMLLLGFAETAADMVDNYAAARGLPAADRKALLVEDKVWC